MSGFGSYGLFDEELEARHNHIDSLMEKKKRDPIYLDWYDNHMVCDHCKTREPLTLPIGFRKAVETMDEFRIRHEQCAEENNA